MEVSCQLQTPAALTPGKQTSAPVLVGEFRISDEEFYLFLPGTELGSTDWTPYLSGGIRIKRNASDVSLPHEKVLETR